MSPTPRANIETMSVQGHYRLAQTLYYTAMLPPIGFVALCAWLLPQLPAVPPDKLYSLETPFLGFTLLSAVLCDTMFYLRLRRFRSLPTHSEKANIPPPQEVKKGWKACVVAWGLVQVYTILAVTEAFMTREIKSCFAFMIFAAITMYRCRPRHGLFAEFNWGTPLPKPKELETSEEESS